MHLYTQNQEKHIKNTSNKSEEIFMTIFNVFSLLGGLALFLFGMDIMGKALEKQAGGQLQKILSTRYALMRFLRNNTA